MSDIDDPRRAFLIQALSAGFYASGLAGILRPAWGMGKVPGILPPGKSIYDMAGQVRVNGKPANKDTFIGPQSLVETGANSHVIFAVEKDAFILRSHSRVEIKGNQIIQSLRLLSGKILSVFGQRHKNQSLGLRTINATIGVRGTGVYMETNPDQSYVCTCYGTADLAAIKDNASHERVVTTHHDSPRYILSAGLSGQLIRPASVIDHTDDELALIEALVGRTVPFAFDGGYGAARNISY